MEKLATSSTTIVSPIRLTSTMKNSSASICGAIFEASGGSSAKFVNHLTRNCQITVLIWSIPLSVHLLACPRLVVFPHILAKHHQHESAQQQQRDQPAQLDNAGHNQRMFVGLRIVVVAVSQNVIPRRADAIGRGLHQSQPQILG